MCYDQMEQTQKRELIKQILDCAIGRMLEYKKEIVKMDYKDYQYVLFLCLFKCPIKKFFFAEKKIKYLHNYKKYLSHRWPDDILNSMKFTPDDIELLASVSGREFVEERRKFIQELLEEKGAQNHFN